MAIEKEKNENDIKDWNYYVYFAIAYYIEIRPVEIIQLKWVNLNGKGFSYKECRNSNQLIYKKIPKPLRKILKEHLKRQKKLPGFNFNSNICGNPTLITFLENV